jgi:GH25 family lysozyme M1 (1,4-beta-N-acetylmuramidase)
MDFNPALRQESDFRLPPQEISLIGKIKSFLSPNIYLRGVDLSHWNEDDYSEVDFVALKRSGIDFVILKATEGTSWVDEKFDKFWRAAHEAGLLIMTYHFFRSNYGGAAQAEHHLEVIAEFLETVGYAHPVIWCDVETADGASVSQLQNRVLAFHQTIVGKGYQSGHYSSPYLWNTLIGTVVWADDYWGWDAHWTSASEPVLPSGWTKNSTRVWQYGIYPTHGWVEPVEGTPGAVDCNRFFGSLQDMEEWLGVETMPPPVDCCDELRAEIARLEAEINANKLEIYHLQQQGGDHGSRLSSIEAWIQSVKDGVCK